MTAQYATYTSGFVDDVTFSHNGANEPRSKSTRMFRRDRHVAAQWGRGRSCGRRLQASFRRQRFGKCRRHCGRSWLSKIANKISGYARMPSLPLLLARCIYNAVKSYDVITMLECKASWQDGVLMNERSSSAVLFPQPTRSAQPLRQNSLRRTYRRPPSSKVVWRSPQYSYFHTSAEGLQRVINIARISFLFSLCSWEHQEEQIS